MITIAHPEQSSGELKIDEIWPLIIPNHSPLIYMSMHNLNKIYQKLFKKKGKRKVQGVPQSQTTALPRPQEEVTNLNKHKPNKRTKSTKISSLFPKQGNRNTKMTEKHKNKMTNGKTYNKSPRRINHKATRSKTNTGTTALEWSVEQTTRGV